MFHCDHGHPFRIAQGLLSRVEDRVLEAVRAESTVAFVEPDDKGLTKGQAEIVTVKAEREATNEMLAEFRESNVEEMVAQLIEGNPTARVTIRIGNKLLVRNP